MSDTADIKARIAFDTELLALAEEREAAYAVRDEDPARWRAAKQRHAEWRTAVKELAIAAGTRKPGTGPSTSTGDE